MVTRIANPSRNHHLRWGEGNTLTDMVRDKAVGHDGARPVSLRMAQARLIESETMEATAFCGLAKFADPKTGEITKEKRRMPPRQVRRFSVPHQRRRQQRCARLS
jgi:hypothetical protein